MNSDGFKSSDERRDRFTSMSLRLFVTVSPNKEGWLCMAKSSREAFLWSLRIALQPGLTEVV